MKHKTSNKKLNIQGLLQSQEFSHNYLVKALSTLAILHGGAMTVTTDIFKAINTSTIVFGCGLLLVTAAYITASQAEYKRSKKFSNAINMQTDNHTTLNRSKRRFQKATSYLIIASAIMFIIAVFIVLCDAPMPAKTSNKPIAAQQTTRLASTLFHSAWPATFNTGQP